jgi:nucleoside-diphosphate-sugar epimerase
LRPPQPQDAYGLEKLASEELAKHYGTDFGMETRIARFHNIYGPFGTWKARARSSAGMAAAGVERVCALVRVCGFC